MNSPILAFGVAKSIRVQDISAATGTHECGCTAWRRGFRPDYIGGNKLHQSLWSHANSTCQKDSPSRRVLLSNGSLVPSEKTIARSLGHTKFAGHVFGLYRGLGGLSIPKGL